MIKHSYWRWFPRGEFSTRLRRNHDESIHVRSNGDLYFIKCDQRIKRTKVRSEKLKQA